MTFPARHGAILLFASAMLHGWASDWPQWRGPTRTGHVPEDEEVPDRLTTEPKVLWRIKAGEGLASPVLAGGRVYYFDNPNGKETLHAIDAATAGEFWRKEIDDPFRDMQGPGGPRCTPVVAGDRVYALSCKGELQCLSVADGQLVWRTNFTNDFGALFIGEKGNAPGAARHGNNGSPLVDGDFLYACVGGTNGAGVVCFEKRTGKVVWKSQNDQAAYAAPVIATLAGARHLICFTVEGLMGLDPKDGGLLWRVPMKTAFARHVTTPVVYNDIVVAGSHQVGLVGVRVSLAAKGFKAEEAWLSRESAMNFASPVAVGKYLYGLGPAKNIICVDIETGEQLWSKEGIVGTSADKAHAAFLVMRSRILILTDSGQLVLMASDPHEFREFGRAQVCAMNWCNPAYADGKLYLRDGIRGAGDLVCVALLP
jgi:outer membrane protein assembly factor BamB